MTAELLPDPTALGAVLDILLPGSAGLPGEPTWPCAAEAIADPVSVWNALPEADRPWLDRLAAAVAARPASERPEALARAETADPEPFGRLVRAAYGAYYNSAPAAAAIRRVLEAGPQDEFVHFDPALTRGVVARAAGARRP